MHTYMLCCVLCRNFLKLASGVHACFFFLVLVSVLHRFPRMWGLEWFISMFDLWMGQNRKKNKERKNAWVGTLYQFVVMIFYKLSQNTNWPTHNSESPNFNCTLTLVALLLSLPSPLLLILLIINMLILRFYLRTNYRYFWKIILWLL